MSPRTGCLALALLVFGVSLAGAQDGSEPSFGDLIKNSPYLQKLGQQSSPDASQSSVPAASTQSPRSPGASSEAAIASARASLQAGRFQDAIAAIQRQLALDPRRAKLRYSLAYVYYAAALAEPDLTRKRQFLGKARDAVYRTLDLEGDPSDPENAVWMTNAETLFDRVTGAGSRPVPPLHGRVVKPYDGTGGVLLGSVLAPDGSRLYDIGGKPVVSFGQGVVEDAGRDPSLGRIIRVRYRDARGQPFVVQYGNLQDTNGLSAGQSVGANTILGHVFKGAAKDEPTLYLEISRQGKSLDAARILTGSSAKDTTF